MPQPAARSADNFIPSRLFPGLGTHTGEGAPGRMEAGFGEPGKAGGAFKMEISGGLEVCEQGGEKMRAVM